MEQKLSDTLVKAIDRSNPFMQNLQLASRFNKLVDESADLEDNKAATIDVSAYTDPVEITPTEGKDGMKKATVTLSNIPSGGTPSVSQMPSWVTEEDFAENVIPSGVQCVAYRNDSHRYIITGDGESTVAELITQVDGYPSPVDWIASYGDGVVMVYSINM